MEHLPPGSLFMNIELEPLHSDMWIMDLALDGYFWRWKTSDWDYEMEFDMLGYLKQPAES